MKIQVEFFRGSHAFRSKFSPFAASLRFNVAVTIESLETLARLSPSPITPLIRTYMQSQQVKGIVARLKAFLGLPRIYKYENCLVCTCDSA